MSVLTVLCLSLAYTRAYMYIVVDIVNWRVPQLMLVASLPPVIRDNRQCPD